METTHSMKRKKRHFYMPQVLETKKQKYLFACLAWMQKGLCQVKNTVYKFFQKSAFSAPIQSSLKSVSIKNRP